MIDETDHTSSVSRRRYLTTVAVGAVAGLAGCSSGGGGGGGSESTTKSSSGGGGGSSGGGGGSSGGGGGSSGGGGGKSYKFGFSDKAANNVWLEVFNKLAKPYAESLGHEMTVTQAGSSSQTQIQNIKSMLNNGVDGLFISPYSSNSTVGVIEQARSQGVPVYTVNSTSPTDAVSMFVGFGSKAAGARIANLMSKELKKNYGGKNVIVLVGDQSDQSAVNRMKGFTEAAKNIDNINPSKIIYNKQWSRQKATQNLTSYLNTNPDFDAIYSVWGGGALAAVDVLKKQGMLTTSDNKENYIPIMNIDGFPGVIDNIKKKNILTTLQQPMPYYIPIAMEYMIDEIESGEAHVPSPGSSPKTADKSNLPNEVHCNNFDINGVKPLSEPYWSPGQVTKWSSDGTDYYPWFQPKTVAITRDNADADYLWGNYASEIL